MAPLIKCPHFGGRMSILELRRQPFSSSSSDDMLDLQAEIPVGGSAALN